MPTIKALALRREVVTRLVKALDAELIETHISWLVLYGESVCKIKKPVRLPFVDYGTLAARQHFCMEELRLNSRLAPSLYLGLARITGTRKSPMLDGAGPVLEYAVRMRRFPKGALFGEQLENATLDRLDVDRLAILLADFHSGQNPAEPSSGFASAECKRRAALAALEGALPVATPAEQARLRTWLQIESTLLAPLWSLRQKEGWVRECHGDLHLDNVVSLEGSVAAFDCIEFDAALRWIDVLDDIAFPVMDFIARGRLDFAFRLLNEWLDRTGSHAGLPALRFSLVYRALVRTQVAHLNGPGHEAAARRYLNTALSLLQPVQAQLRITHGLPGSGKTFESQQVLEREGAIRLRSDVERKRLFGLGMQEDSRAKGLDLYNPQANARTYAQLFKLARMALEAGYPVVVDAAFLHRTERAQAVALAGELGLPVSIIECQAPLQVMHERLAARRGDASEATAAVLDALRLSAEPLDAQELGLVISAAGQCGQKR